MCRNDVYYRGNDVIGGREWRKTMVGYDVDYGAGRRAIGSEVGKNLGLGS